MLVTLLRRIGKSKPVELNTVDLDKVTAETLINKGFAKIADLSLEKDKDEELHVEENIKAENGYKKEVKKQKNEKKTQKDTKSKKR